ncbi:MAG: type I DNA topoisomerase [bacterium]
MKSIVIVESPAKAKTINKILGKGFTVKASVGHIKDLPGRELGVDVRKNFTPSYVIIPGKEKIIAELRKAAKDADQVYLAPDPDREGEAIAWHIAEEIQKGAGRTKKKPKVQRITFNEITEKAVREAIKHPTSINMDKVDAQQARRVLDRLVGYGLSPLLWKKVRRGLSAGRVQSVAVKIIVDREREIRAFKAEEYWSIEANFEGPKLPQFKGRLYKYQNELVISRDVKKGNTFLLTSEKTAHDAIAKLQGLHYALSSIEKREKSRSAAPPFITSTVQQEASKKLRFTAKKTMMIAQQLYEGIEMGDEGSVGLITYMRTDSTRTAPEAVQWAREMIGKEFGADYLPKKPPQYKVKATAQEAHEAIRPTYPDKSPERIKKYLNKDQLALYTLIWKRFLASQMAPARLEQTLFVIQPVKGAGIEFRASGTVIKFKGFLALYDESEEETVEEEEAILPDLKDGDALKLLELAPRQHFTQPPPRFSEALLVKTLEEKGIGRPSTYAAILSTVQERRYVEKKDGRFMPTELGEVVNDLLVERFNELVNEEFTAKMEAELDGIEEGKMNWVKVIHEFYDPFDKDLVEATKTLGRVKPEDKPTDLLCEKCGMPMVIRWGRHGRFMACTGYPKCKNTKPLEGEENARQKGMSVPVNEVCEKCGSPMVLKTSRFGRFLACSRYPECKTTRSVSTGVKCPEDGGDIVERATRRGKVFFSCSNYPQCKFATWYRPVAKHCPQCDREFLVDKRTKAGHFLICLKKECGYTEEVRDEE